MNPGVIIHFQKKDPIISKYIQKSNSQLVVYSPEEIDYFTKLCRDIISQQLASAAARTIVGRFNDLFSAKLSPEKVIEIEDQMMRDVGLSWAKVKYVNDLAQKVVSKKVVLDDLFEMSDEDVIAQLTKVKGIGNWTAEMFLIFTLGREDVFSYGDLALKKAIMSLYGFSEKPSNEEMEEIVSCWSPYKSYGCLALWESLDKKG